MDEFLTVGEIAELLRVNQQTVHNWIDRRELPAVRVGARRVRIRRSDLDTFLAAGATAPAEAAESNTRDQFLGALTEILRTAAASEDSHDMASALRELAAAAEALTASPRTSRGTGGWSHDRATARHERSCQAPERPSVVVLAEARADRVPPIRLGKYVRFSEEELLERCQACRRRPRPTTDDAANGQPEHRELARQIIWRLSVSERVLDQIGWEIHGTADTYALELDSEIVALLDYIDTSAQGCIEANRGWLGPRDPRSFYTPAEHEAGAKQARRAMDIDLDAIDAVRLVREATTEAK